MIFFFFLMCGCVAGFLLGARLVPGCSAGMQPAGCCTPRETAGGWLGGQSLLAGGVAAGISRCPAWCLLSWTVGCSLLLAAT